LLVSTPGTWVNASPLLSWADFSIRAGGFREIGYNYDGMRWAVCAALCVVSVWAAEPAKDVFDRAVRALSVEDYANAERGFQSVLRLEPRNVAALGNLGVIYSRTGRADQAITSYRRALELSPDDQAIVLNLGLLYLRQENYTRALPLFERVVKLAPQNLQARQLQALCRAYLGQTAPAIADLETLRAAAPHDENILFLLGLVYLKSHDADKAKAVFAQMFDEAGPARAEFLLGKAYYEAALFPQAEDSFLRVFRQDPNFPGVHLELGKVYISMRRNDDAARELKAALGRTAGDPDASYFLGGLLVQSGQYAEGIPYLERAKAARPDFWAPYFYLGKAKLRLEKPAEAAALLERAAKLSPDDINSYYLLGRALQACGRQTEARQALAKVRELRAGALEAAPLDGDSGVAGAR
jgi:tetratricopeptide (TPR) repeat protein